MELNKDLDVDDNNNDDPCHSLHHHDYGVYKRMIYYLRKSYYNTVSLMGNSCKSAAVLGL